MASEVPAGEVTQLLLRWRAGDEKALAMLVPLVYEELRAMARRHMNHERGSHTLQRTALVNEAFLRMVDQKQIDWQGRSQFFGIASQMMRRVLVDHARRRDSAKRGGGAERIDLDAVIRSEDSDAMALKLAESGPVPSADDDIDVEAVHNALERLEALDPDQAKLVELRYFGGLTLEEAAAVMGVSLSTAKREWAIAKGWLHRELAREP